MEDRKIKLKNAVNEYKSLKEKMREEELKGYGWPEEWLMIQHNLESEIRELAGASMIIEMYDKLIECRDAIRELTTENEKLRAELRRLDGLDKKMH